MDPAHGGTGLGAWHNTSITGSLRWPWSRQSLSYILRAKAFSYKLESERPHLPHQALCQLVRRGHLPPPCVPPSHHMSLAGQGDDSAHRQHQPPIARNEASRVCFLCSCSAGLFFHLLLPGAICDARKSKHDPVCLGYFHLSSATSCHCSVVSMRVTLQGGRKG